MSVRSGRFIAASLTGAAVVAATVIGLPAIAAGSAEGSTPVPMIELDPANNVPDGGTILVSGSGFQVSTTVYLIECDTPVEPTEQDCDSAVIGLGSTDDTGAFQNVPLVVHSVADDPDGLCSPGAACFVLATTDVTGTMTQDEATAEFTFAAAGSPALTTTSARLHHHHSIHGSVEAVDASARGLTVRVKRRHAGHWVKVAHEKTKAHGKFDPVRVSRAGTYKVQTPAQRRGKQKYLASHSNRLVVSH